MIDGWITPEDLEHAGYKRHDHPPAGYGDVLYQKCVRQDDTKLYYIDMCVYDFAGQLPFGGYQIRVEALTQLCFNGDTRFNVKLLPKQGMTIEEIERFFHQQFWVMGCDPEDGTLGPLTRVARAGHGA